MINWLCTDKVMSVHALYQYDNDNDNEYDLLNINFIQLVNYF